jgi:hypothetical protein
VRSTLPISLLTALLACTGCATVTTPPDEIVLRLEEASGRRFVGVTATRDEGAVEVSGSLHGLRLSTADRRTLWIDVVDEAGQAGQRLEVVATGHLSSQDAGAIDRARFRCELPVPPPGSAIRVRVASR